jgi:energy-coupling factor transporter ATP-binding protein EcfA2
MPSNVLLLDEPTNHLDIPAREAIESFMLDSSATLLVVSHDRRLLETICTKLWVVGDGVAAAFDGGYRAWRVAVAAGWTVTGAAQRPPAARGAAIAVGASAPPGARAMSAGPSSPPAAGVRAPRPARRGASGLEGRYRRQRTVLDAELSRLGLRKSHLELRWATRRSRRTSSRCGGSRASRRRRRGAGRRRGRLAGARGAGPVTLRIGLTGPIGCGKSTVAGWLAELGAHAIDADEVARAVTAPGEPALDVVIARFGERYRRPDGGLDRAALAELVFSDPVALGDLEAITHPQVRKRIGQALRADEDAAWR